MEYALKILMGIAMTCTVLSIFMPQRLGFFLKSPTRLKTAGSYYIVSCLLMIIAMMNMSGVPAP